MIVDRELYKGREQAFIKHSLLRDYFSALIHKIASSYDDFVYVDGFSGPWGNSDDVFGDTSFGIALTEMRKAKKAYSDRGRSVQMRALLVERRARAYRKLETVKHQYPEINIETFNGEFVNLVPLLLSRIPRNAFSFIFIDPKGWRIDMNAVKPLIKRPHCEVLFNFMFEFINRAASMAEPVTVKGIDELITTEGWRPKLMAAVGVAGKTLADVRKEVLIEAFSDTLRAAGNYEFVAETPIFRPNKDRTLYSLIYATRKPPGIVEFRRVQIAALKIQELVRSDLQREKSFGDQIEFFGHTEMGRSEVEIYLSTEKEKASLMLLDLAPKHLDGTTYANIWPCIMAKHAVTKSDLNAIAAGYRKDGRLQFPDWQVGKRIPSEDGRLIRAE